MLCGMVSCTAFECASTYRPGIKVKTVAQSRNEKQWGCGGPCQPCLALPPHQNVCQKSACGRQIGSPKDTKLQTQIELGSCRRQPRAERPGLAVKALLYDSCCKPAKVISNQGGWLLTKHFFNKPALGQPTRALLMPRLSNARSYPKIRLSCTLLSTRVVLRHVFAVVSGPPFRSHSAISGLGALLSEPSGCTPETLSGRYSRTGTISSRR